MPHAGKVAAPARRFSGFPTGPYWSRAAPRYLFSVPGVGPVVATTFAATLDDASRFLGAKHVRSYLGLVPREYSSGERQRRGRISKAGSARARSLMVEAAWSLLRWKTERTRALHEWWTRIAQRHGKATAVVALARKLRKQGQKRRSG